MTQLLWGDATALGLGLVDVLVSVSFPLQFLPHNRMSVVSLCNHDMSVIVVVVVVIGVICEHSS